MQTYTCRVWLSHAWHVLPFIVLARVPIYSLPNWVVLHSEKIMETDDWFHVQWLKINYNMNLYL